MYIIIKYNNKGIWRSFSNILWFSTGESSAASRAGDCTSIRSADQSVRALLLGPETAPASEVQIKANALQDFSEGLLYSYNNSIIISEFLPFIYIENINWKQLCYLGHNCFKLISNLALLTNLKVGGSYLGWLSIT